MRGVTLRRDSRARVLKTEDFQEFFAGKIIGNNEQRIIESTIFGGALIDDVQCSVCHSYPKVKNNKFCPSCIVYAWITSICEQNLEKLKI